MPKFNNRINCHLQREFESLAIAGCVLVHGFIQEAINLVRNDYLLYEEDFDPESSVSFRSSILESRMLPMVKVNYFTLPSQTLFLV